MHDLILNMKLTVNQTQIEFPTFKYNDIKEEGWYQCENWTLLFLKKERGTELFPVLGYNDDGFLRPILQGHLWNEYNRDFRRVPFSLTIDNSRAPALLAPGVGVCKSSLRDHENS